MPAAEASVDVTARTIDAKVNVNVPVDADLVVGVYVNGSDVTLVAAVPEPDATVPDDAETAQVDPAATAVSVVAVTEAAVPIVSAGCENATEVGNVYACKAHVTRARVRAMTNVAVVAPVDPEYVVASVSAPMAVKLPVAARGPSVSPVSPEAASIALDTTLPVPNLASIVATAPANVYGTWTVAPSTHAYTDEPATVEAEHVVGPLTTASAGETSVDVYPSGPVTTTANATEPDAGMVDASVYVATDAECVALSYAHVGVVPYVVPVATESTHVTEPVLISVVLAIVASYPVSASTTELAFPAPHTTSPLALGP